MIAQAAHEAHPLADLLPAMTADEFSRLAADIRVNGLVDPIVLYEGKVLDGRHRLRACLEAGIAPQFTQYTGDSPAQHVLSLNLHRRHLTSSQLAMVGADFLPHLEAETKKRQAHGQTAPGRSRSNDRERWEDRDPGHTGVAGEVGQVIGVSATSIRRAKRITEDAPDLAEKVRAGNMTVNGAYDRIKDPAPITPPRPVVPLAEMTDRQRQNAEAAKERVQRVVGTCNGLHRGLDELKLSEAIQVSSIDEVTDWVAAINDAKKALTRMHNRLKEAMK